MYIGGLQCVCVICLNEDLVTLKRKSLHWWTHKPQQTTSRVLFQYRASSLNFNWQWHCGQLTHLSGPKTQRLPLSLPLPLSLSLSLSELSLPLSANGLLFKGPNASESEALSVERYGESCSAYSNRFEVLLASARARLLVLVWTASRSVLHAAPAQKKGLHPQLQLNQ